MTEDNKKNKTFQLFKYIALNVVIAAITSFFLITFVASAYRINGLSMHETLKHRERIIIWKIGIPENVKRLDIVVITKPDEEEKSIIKRVIGLPNEVIDIRDGVVYINDKPLDEPYLGRRRFSPQFRWGMMRPITIPKGYYFVMGDNRPFSYDSRRFGPVHGDLIHGKTLLRYWPFSRFGTIK